MKRVELYGQVRQAVIVQGIGQAEAIKVGIPALPVKIANTGCIRIITKSSGSRDCKSPLPQLDQTNAELGMQ